MAEPIRKENKDIPKQVLLTWDLCKRSEERADELDMSYSRYVRHLIIEDLKKADMERVSQESASNNTHETVELLNSLNSMVNKNPALISLLQLMVKNK